jgi:hypothetical protein
MAVRYDRPFGQNPFPFCRRQTMKKALFTLFAVAALVVSTTATSQAQVVVGYPVTTYYAPATTYYAPAPTTYVPTTTYYTPTTTLYAPTTSYYVPSATAVPATTYYAPTTTYYAPSATTAYYAPRTTLYTPTTALYAPTTTYYGPVTTPGRTVVGRTTYYVPGQPIRNALRALGP